MQRLSNKKVVGGQRPVHLGASRALSARRFRDPLVGAQQTIGNHGLLRRKGEVVQPKLKIGAPNDKYEQEADRVADMVMRMPELKVQRQEEDEEDEDKEPIRMKPVGKQYISIIQRQSEEEDEGEEEPEQYIQAKGVSKLTPEVTQNMQERINTLRFSGHPLPRSIRNFFEPRFAHDFSEVRVHTDLQANEIAHGLSALAFTVRNDIVFGAGQYKPETVLGQQLIAHELSHVAQQRKRGTPQRVQKKPKRLSRSTANPKFDLQVILGPAPKEQSIAYNQKILLELYRYLKSIRRFGSWGQLCEGYSRFLLPSRQRRLLIRCGSNCSTRFAP
jgi:hypothetical protein